MSNTCTIYLTRHGQSTTNRDGVVSGHLNPDLTELGVKQAHDLKDRFKHVKFDDVYSSDLMRASHTAQIVAGKPVPTDHQFKDLRERNFGQLEGKPTGLYDALYQEYLRKSPNLTPEQRWSYKLATDVESNKELADRFINAVKRIGKSHPGQTILIVAHGGSIRATLVQLGFLSEHDLPPGSFKNCGSVKLEYDPTTDELEFIKLDGIDQTAAPNE